MTDGQPLADLARRWSDLLVADVPPGQRATRAVRETGSVLRAPATEDAVTAAEDTLGRRLPPSYREFLLLSDGAYGDAHGAALARPHAAERPDPASPVLGIRLLRAADLRWLRDVNPFLASLCEDADEADGRPVVVDGREVWPWAPFAAGLVIGIDHAPGTTCLVPVEDAEEWQVWVLVKETAQAFVSFRSFLQHEVDVREPVTTAAETRELVERARADDWRAARRLERVTAPDAVDVLIPLLGTRAAVGWASRAVLGLGRIGTDDAVDALVRLRPHGARHALLLAGTDRARDVLASWGCARELAALGDPRAVTIAVRALAPGADVTRDQRDEAITVLSVAGDAGHADVLRPHLDGEPVTEFLAAHAMAVLDVPEGRHRLEAIAAGGGPMHHSARGWVLALAPDDGSGAPTGPEVPA